MLDVDYLEAGDKVSISSYLLFVIWILSTNT
jgi:hypothetical protein